MKEDVIKEEFVRRMVADININIKGVEDELVKLSNKLKNKSLNEFIIVKINKELNYFHDNILKNKENRIEFLKLKDSISRYLMDIKEE